MVDKLRQSRTTISIPPSSLSIQQVKGSGPGGQAVNKTNNAVAITHNETGIRVKVKRGNQKIIYLVSCNEICSH